MPARLLPSYQAVIWVLSPVSALFEMRDKADIISIADPGAAAENAVIERGPVQAAGLNEVDDVSYIIALMTGTSASCQMTQIWRPK